jgi:hypothetical protein
MMAMCVHFRTTLGPLILFHVRLAKMSEDILYMGRMCISPTTATTVTTYTTDTPPPTADHLGAGKLQYLRMIVLKVGPDPLP